MLPGQFFYIQFHHFQDLFEITQCSGGKLTNAINCNFALGKPPEKNGLFGTIGPNVGEWGRVDHKPL